MRVFQLIICLLLPSALIVAEEQRISIFDGHIHYNHDVWEPLPPAKALEYLTRAGITRAIVSSWPTDGTERLYKADPKRVVPFLRPYKDNLSQYTWFKDPDAPAYVKKHLQRIPYRGIGELHLFGDDTKRPVVREVLKTVRKHQLVVLAHTNEKGLVLIFEQVPDNTVIWAHTGFDVDVSRLRALLNTHPKLYLELSFREGMTNEEGKLTTEWHALLIDHSARFLVGMDTYTPNRWAELTEHAAEARGWLSQLPTVVARKIAYGNAANLFND